MGVHSFAAVSTELAPLHLTVVGIAIELPEEKLAAERMLPIEAPLKGQDVPRRLRAFSLLLRAVERWKEKKRQTEEDRKNFLYPTW